jgi:cell division protein FtsW (lipid II flippase)
MLQRPDYARVPWWWLGFSALLSAIGLAFVLSATQDTATDGLLTREAVAQFIWLMVGMGACLVAMHISPTAWRRFALPIGLGGWLLVVLMMLLAGTPLMPAIKGQSNWIVIGSLRIQPVELVKLSAVLGCAAVAAEPGFDAKRISHCLGLLLVAGIPAGLLAREDLGSALTFAPMAMGMLVIAGMRLRHLALAGLTVLALGFAAYHVLPREGPKAYQWRRIDAFLHPDRYALAEAYQTERSKRSIGSGQWVGKGYMAGEQNRLGWVPEKHTDLVFAVVGEEVGFLGSATLVVLLLAWCGAGLLAAARAPGPFSTQLCGGFTCLIAGQAGINLAVATGLMPVTGVTLPFVSYGGSSMVACWLGVGIACSGASQARET